VTVENRNRDGRRDGGNEDPNHSMVGKKEESAVEASL